MTLLVLVITAATLVVAGRRGPTGPRLRGLAPAPSRTTALMATGRAICTRLASWRRRRSVDRGLPVTVELLRMALSAGLTPGEAVRSIAPLAPGPSGRALSEAVRALDLGLGIDDALAQAASRCPGLGTVAEVLAAARVLGSGIDGTLARLGSEARAELRRSAEARARTVPVRLLFPLVLCILPAFALLGIAPSLLAGLTG